jgi:predicted unusual protein kinase regulating ubiquinone biosynthesis (AarF/ABC1/UbiB family)
MLAKASEICMKFMYNYLTASNDTTLTGKANQVKCLSQVFANYGGILAKISQMICIEDGEGAVYSECKPYSMDKTIEYFTNEVSTNTNGFFDSLSKINLKVYKSGSVGQVHKAVYTDESGVSSNVVIKVQYVGLRDQFDTDLRILKMVSKFLYNFIDDNTEKQVISKLYEELDYRVEFNNQQTIYDIWKDDPTIIIPKLIPSMCTETILTSEFVDAEDMFSFIKNSTQSQRNTIGMSILRFIYTNMFKHGIFYSDIHYGNFLIKDKTTLVVIDFGCLNKIEKELSDNLISIHTSVLEDDKILFYETVSDMGILNEELITPESRVHMWEYFKLQFKPLTSEYFEFNKKWLPIYTHKDMDIMDDWVLPGNCVYFNKINFGMSHLLAELNLQGNILELFENCKHKILLV